MPEDNTFGFLSENGTWSGLMGTLVNQQADVALTLMVMSESRLNALNFLPPLWELK